MFIGAETDRFRQMRNFKRSIIFIAIICIIAIIDPLNKDTGKNSNNSSNNASNTTKSTAVDTSWFTSDFYRWEDGSQLAYTIDRVTDSQCGYGAGCLGIIVQAKNGCPNSLYAEIELLDGSDINVGYSNDSIGSLGAMKKAKLKFHLSDSEISQVKDWNITKISCY